MSRHPSPPIDNAFERKYANHPLELIAYFRRWPASLVRNLLYTFIWNCLIATGLMLIMLMFSNPKPLSRFIWVTFVVTQSVGYSIHGLLQLGYCLLGHWLIRMPKWLRQAYFMLVPTAGVFLGYGIGFSLLNMESTRRYFFSAQGIKSVMLFAIGISVVLTGVFINRDRQKQAELALAEQRQRTLDADRRALEAQLRMLQAQIEPHFLYNTLANAVGLIGPAPDKARHLLEKLIDYLRASLTASREAETQLGRELATLQAYLELMQVRMGERLRFQIDCPDELLASPLPPMLLQPLVENALQHGLEPKLDGGELRVWVEADAAALQIHIRDTGRGIDPAAKPRTGGGVGLSNLRERLAALHGPQASLRLAEHQPSGVHATLHLPRG